MAFNLRTSRLLRQKIIFSLQQYFNTTATGTRGNAYMNSFERESMTFREGVDLMVDRAALAIKLSPDALKVVKACNAVLQLKFPVKLKGRTKVISGWWGTSRHKQGSVICITLARISHQAACNTNNFWLFGEK